MSNQGFNIYMKLGSYRAGPAVEPRKSRLVGTDRLNRLSCTYGSSISRFTNLFRRSFLKTMRPSKMYLSLFTHTSLAIIVTLDIKHL